MRILLKQSGLTEGKGFLPLLTPLLMAQFALTGCSPSLNEGAIAPPEATVNLTGAPIELKPEASTWAHETVTALKKSVTQSVSQPVTQEAVIKRIMTRRLAQHDPRAGELQGTIASLNERIGEVESDEAEVIAEISRKGTADFSDEAEQVLNASGQPLSPSAQMIALNTQAARLAMEKTKLVQEREETRLALARLQASQEMQTRLEAIVASVGTIQDLHQFKMEIETQVEKQAPARDLIYRQDATTLAHVLNDREIQGFSGTEFFLLSFLEKSRAQKTMSSVPGRHLVVIQTPGHMLPGYMTRKSGEWELIGIEMSNAGRAQKFYGPTAQLSGEIRVVDAELYLLTQTMQSDLTDESKTKLVQFAAMEAKRMYGVPVPKIGSKTNSGVTGTSSLLSSSSVSNQSEAFQSSIFSLPGSLPGDSVGFSGPRRSLDSEVVFEFSKLSPDQLHELYGSFHAMKL